METTKPVCRKARNRAFIAPTAVRDYSIRAAVKLCEYCPLKRRCALDALHSGDSLDGSVTSPANDVIAAGVVCVGDEATAEALAAVAGVDVPKYRASSARSKAPERCVNCRHMMVSWTRNKVPEGYVMHHARGYCTGCRKAYEHVLKGVERKPKLAKEIDRDNAYRTLKRVDYRRRFVARYVPMALPDYMANDLHKWVCDCRQRYKETAKAA